MCRRRTRNTSSSVTDSCLLKPSLFLSSCFRMYKIRTSAAVRQTNHCLIARLFIQGKRTRWVGNRMNLVTTLASSHNTTTWQDSKKPLKVRLLTMPRHAHSPTEQLGSRRILLTAVWTASSWWNNSFTVRRVQRWTRDILTNLLIVWGKKLNNLLLPSQQ